MDAPPIAPLDLAAERDSLGPALEEAVLEVLRSGRYVGGPEVESLERSFAELCGVDHAVAVSSGTDALVLALKALGAGPERNVVTSPFTFFASAATVAWVGATPRLADVDEDTALLSPEAAAAAVDDATVALMPVHLYGQMADAKGFRALADERSVALIEDAAQSHGARRDGEGVGVHADAACFSFYPTKNLGTAGEGGLVVARDEDVARRLRLLRDHGMEAKYLHTSLGTNARLPALLAAVLNVKLPHLARWNERRRAIAARYDGAFAGSTLVRPLVRAPGCEHVYHQYAVRISGPPRDEVAERLAERGVLAAVHYPRPVHLQPAAAAWGYGPGDFPVAERLASQVLCLPVHPFLADGDADRVAETLLSLVG